MRCPKCHYLSFDPEPRCKNCGYGLDVESEDLALMIDDPEPASEPELQLRRDELPSRPITLELVRPSTTIERTREPEPEPQPQPEPALELVGAVAAPPAPRRPAPRASNTTAELPLFVKAMAALESTVAEPPVVTRTAAPAPPALDGREIEIEDDEPQPVMPVELPPASRPLSVRRPVEPQRPAPRIERRVGPLDRDLLEDLRRLEREETRMTSGEADFEMEESEDFLESDSVPISHRAGAAAFDGVLLGGIGAFVLWATLKLTDAAPSDLGAAALFPMAIFLVAVGVAYLVMFTAANGQTVGKMLMGIKVVGDDPDGSRLTLGQVAGRSLLAPLSLALFGLGWIPAMLGRRLALHDRLAHTRVVRA